MHTCYLVETIDKPDRIDVYDGIIAEMIDPYYCEYDAEAIHWDWCEIGGRWSGEIPNNCCQGCDIPEDFEPYGVITEFECIDRAWYDEDFWEYSANMTREELQEQIRIQDEKATERFRSLFEIDPDRWYTLVDFHS